MNKNNWHNLIKKTTANQIVVYLNTSAFRSDLISRNPPLTHIIPDERKRYKREGCHKRN